MDCSLTSFSVHGNLQARILEWVAMSFPRRSSWPRNQTRVSCIAGRFFTDWAMRELLCVIILVTWRTQYPLIIFIVFSIKQQGRKKCKYLVKEICKFSRTLKWPEMLSEIRHPCFSALSPIVKMNFLKMVSYLEERNSGIINLLLCVLVCWLRYYTYR